MSWLDTITFNTDGLIPVIAQDHETGRLLMMAWMNAESLKLTAETKTAVYFSRSRQKIWHKGETSGHTQQVHSIRLDCDADVIVLSISQIGGISCHTGRESCFYRELDLTGKTPVWQIKDSILKNPDDIYGNKNTSHHDQTHHNEEFCSTNSSQVPMQRGTTDILSTLDVILSERKNASADSSYVASLYHKGLNKILEKVAEESFETIIAAKDYQNTLDQNHDSNHQRDDLVYEIADVWFHTMVTLAWFNIESEAILTELARRFGLSGLDEKASRTS